MEISEQVGMTPEIIQKVLFLFFVLHKSFFSNELSVFFSLSFTLKICFFLFAASRQSHYPYHRKKEGIMLLLKFPTLYIILSHSQTSLTSGLLCP